MSLVHNALATGLLAGLAGLLTLALPVPPAAASDPVAPHLWKSRLLVVIASDRANPNYVEQLRLYERAKAGMRERDLVLVEGIGGSADAEALRRRYSVPHDPFRAILVGKDGGAKLSAAAPIPAETLFETIDTMPMRQDEMKGRRS